MQEFHNRLKIGIYSLGLIGGSLYKGLAKFGGANLLLCTRNKETVASLSKTGENISDTPDVLSDAQIIFVCSPIFKIVDVIRKLYELNPNAIFVDVASLKYDILAQIEQIEGCKFIGSHPMAGTENSGFKASFPELFEGAKWVVTPSKYINNDDVNLLCTIIELLGASPILMDAREHDKAVAAISHLPMLLSQSMVFNIKNDKNALLLAASGFRDTTRLAVSNKIMAKDMLQFNKKNIKSALEDVVKYANELLLSEFFDENIETIIKTRKNLYNASGKNSFRNNG